MTGELRHLGIGRDQPVAEYLRVRSGEAQAADAVNLGEITDEQRQIGEPAAMHRPAPGVDVLPQQGHLAHATLREMRHFRDHVVEGAREFLAAGVGHDTIGTVLAATLHDRDEGTHAIHAWCGQAVEFLDLGKGHVHRGPVRGQYVVQHLRQAVQGLRAEHQVHIRRAPDDRRTLLTRDTTADTDNNPGPGHFQFAPQAELGEHLLLRLLADGTGIEQQHVGLGRILGGFEPMAGRERVRHARGIVLVHLATEGLDVQLAGHAGGIKPHRGQVNPLLRRDGAVSWIGIGGDQA